MSRTSVYLSEELLAAARKLEINVSAVCQAALQDEITRRMNALNDAIEAGENARALLIELNGAVHVEAP